MSVLAVVRPRSDMLTFSAVCNLVVGFLVRAAAVSLNTDVPNSPHKHGYGDDAVSRRAPHIFDKEILRPFIPDTDLESNYTRF